jgi:hypothetical protein
VSGFGVPGDGNASLVLGLAIVLASCVPLWALLLWMAASSLSWRWRAERSWKRFLVPVAVFAAVIGGGYSLSWVMHGLFGRSRPTEQDVVYWVSLVQLLLAGIAGVVVASARASTGAGTASGAHWKQRRGRAVVLTWGALAVVLTALRALAGESAPSGDWWALAASSGVLVTLVVLLIIAIVELRKDAKGSGPAATRRG